MRQAARRGLSPLIAAVVLISATIVGGMLVYQYFQNTMHRAQAMSEGIAVTANAIPLSGNTSLVSVTVLNNYDTPIQVTGAIAVYPDGTTRQLQPANGTSLPVAIPAGAKTSLLFTSTGTPAAVTIKYSVNGQAHTSEPARIG